MRTHVPFLPYCTWRPATYYRSTEFFGRPYTSLAKQTSRQTVKEAYSQTGQSWNPAIRALASKNQPTLLYRSRDVTPRTVCRLFIGVSSFVMAAHCAVVCVDPPENFSPILRRFMVVAAFVTSGFGLAALCRNTLAVKSIVAVPSRSLSTNKPGSIALRIETTNWVPWQANVLMVQPREVRLSQPLPATGSMNLATNDASAIKIALQLPFLLFASQFRHLWDTIREIIFASDTFMSIEGRTDSFRVDDNPAFAAGGGIGLNKIVRHDL